MKVFFLILIFLIRQEDNYFVLMVHGNVTNMDTGRPLKVGDKLSSNSQFSFGSKSDYLEVVSRSLGRVKIDAVSASSKSVRNAVSWVAVLKDYLLPTNSVKGLYKRGDIDQILIKNEIFNSNREISTHFTNLLKQSKQTVLLLNELNIYLNSKVYQHLEYEFFYIQYLQSGDTINKKLNFTLAGRKKDILKFTIEKSAFKTDDSAGLKQRIENVGLFFYNSHEQASYEIAKNMSFVFADPQVVKAQVDLLKLVFDGAQRSSIFSDLNEYILMFLSENYGAISFDDFEVLRK